MLMRSGQISRPVFFGMLAPPFFASLLATLAWGVSMVNMAGIPMPGGWILSMAWMPMCGQTWAGTAATFVGMWGVMMVAMMLPPLAPALWRYHQAVAGAAVPTLLAALGYFSVWILACAAIFPVGAVLASAALELPGLARGLPAAGGAVVLAAGMAQFGAWKARQLACCRAEPRCGYGLIGLGTAWRHGLRLGLHCLRCCAGPMAVLLATGVMDLTGMVVVTAAICLERLVPGGERLARVTGGIAVLAGAVMILQAVRLL
jgi:predicted metal-binding membrane protein